MKICASKVTTAIWLWLRPADCYNAGGEAAYLFELVIVNPQA
jgi:hypothetical protein